jgi:hypothetical protein
VTNSQRIANLFQGLQSAHGIFMPERFEGKKQIGKAMTVREPVTEQLWLSHLAGKVGLGIIPINEQSECRWAAIDIDDYDLDFDELLEKIEKTPLVCCRSKSGGAHLYIFVSGFISSLAIRDYLRNLVGNLGLGRSEIFPKQDKILPERGDVGNWLNMPYFGNLRKCIIGNSEIKELSLEEFLDYAESRRVGKEFFCENWRNRLRQFANRWWTTLLTGDVPLWLP